MNFFLVPPELGARGLKSIHATQQISLDALAGWVDAEKPNTHRYKLVVLKHGDEIAVASKHPEYLRKDFR